MKQSNSSVQAFLIAAMSQLQIPSLHSLVCAQIHLIPERPEVRSHHRLALYEQKKKGNLRGQFTSGTMKTHIFLTQV